MGEAGRHTNRHAERAHLDTAPKECGPWTSSSPAGPNSPVHELQARTPAVRMLLGELRARLPTVRTVL